MNYILSGHNYIQDVQPMIQVFFPNEHYTELQEPSLDGVTVLSEIKDGVCKAIVFDSGTAKCEKSENVLGFAEKRLKMAVKRTIYLVLSGFLNIENPWGILTGIRPAKIVMGMLLENTEKSIIEKLKSDYFVVEEKTKLAIEVAKKEKFLLADTQYAGKASVYIGIPFCPTTCLYCSFTSYPINKYKDKQEAYLFALFKELDFIKNHDKFNAIDTLYIGGGTPTSLSEKDLEALLLKVSQNFNIDKLREFSVEAGRPDTLNKTKLSLLKDFGVTRISINPQTVHDKTLKIIGRNHTAAEFFDSYETALKAGFNNINIDVILGLPGESAEDVIKTFEAVGNLKPNSLTVHTLAVKRASRLMESIRQTVETVNLTNVSEIIEMLGYSQDFTAKAGLMPYYMYRQKNMLGNFENVGYAKPGYECLYNILIMEEIQTVLAVGAGAVTKIVHGDKIERVFNVKNVDEYIERIDEMIERKSVGFAYDSGR